MNKAVARAAARSRVRAMTADELRHGSERIAEAVWALPEIASARTLLLFASTAAEVQTDPIAAEALRRGIILTYPRCIPESRQMSLHSLEDLAELREEGGYGIREPPVACPRLSLEEIDAAMVPGLAWDRQGTRLGRGAGYYDRLFAEEGWRGFRCGLFFDAQELTGLPRDPWDVPLDAVVTENGVVRIV
jgi:5-formyltetrahydrofolate cyclo-ligase